MLKWGTSSSFSGFQVPHNYIVFCIYIYRYNTHVHTHIYIYIYYIYVYIYIHTSYPLQDAYLHISTIGGPARRHGNASAPPFHPPPSRCWFPISKGRRLPLCRVGLVCEIRKPYEYDDRMMIIWWF